MVQQILTIKYIYQSKNSQTYQPMSSYYQVLREIQTQQVLKRSRLEAQLSQSLARQTNAEVQLAKRNLELQTFLEDEELQRQKFIQKQLNEAVLRRSRLQVDIETNRIEREAALRRSRLDTEIRTDKINRHLEKSRLQSQIQASRLESKKAMEDALRRSKVQANSNMFLNKY